MSRQQTTAPALRGWVSESPWHAESERLLDAWKTAESARVRSSEARHRAWQSFFAHPSTVTRRAAMKTTKADDKAFEAQEAAWTAYLTHSKERP